MSRHRLAVLVALLAVASQWAQAGSVVPSSPVAVEHAASVALPLRPVVSPAPAPATVATVRPDVRVDGVARDALSRDPAIDGLQDAIVVGSVDLAVDAPGGARTVSALVVDPKTFRRFTPEATAEDDDVWNRLSAGEVVLSTAAAKQLEAVPGTRLAFAGNQRRELLRVGALAANGLPELADALVTPKAAARLTAKMTGSLLVAIDDKADFDDVVVAVHQRFDGPLSVLATPETTRLRSQSVRSADLPGFSYEEVGDGTIRISRHWLGDNIVTASIPIIGKVTCHRTMISQMRGAFAAIKAAGLADQIRSFGGCWVPRHILGDPDRSLSRHAWGLAFDINAPSNGYGRTPTLSHEIVEIFRRWGFAWGGDFSTPDGMHFELARIIDF